jgi:purine nucleosidase/pyrimidine-specific ribonucleoside hydrolase
MTIIIDTDPGIDDAIAILYALRSGLPVAAITTVAGNIGLTVTTRNAGRLVALAGATVPVHAGAAAPLQGHPRPETGIHGNDGLGGVAFPEPARPADGEEAVAALIRHIAAAGPGGVTLFCLGPLTNLARLIQSAPDAATKLGPVIAMGGAVSQPGNVGPRAEFNLAHDPIAADIVLSAGLDLTLIPLDATRQFRANQAYIDTLLATDTPASRASAALITAYFAATTGQESRPLHDPCVPLYFARPDLFRVETHHLRVAVGSGALDPGPYAIKVVMGVDADAVRAELNRGLSL